jgi:hypothetical protein
MPSLREKSLSHPSAFQHQTSGASSTITIYNCKNSPRIMPPNNPGPNQRSRFTTVKKLTTHHAGSLTILGLGPKIWASSIAISKKLPKVNNHPMGKKSPNPVTLARTLSRKKVFTIEILVLEQVCLRWFSKHFWQKKLVKRLLISTLDKVIYYKGTFLQDSTKPLLTTENRLEPDEKKFALFSTCVFYVVQRFLCF